MRLVVPGRTLRVMGVMGVMGVLAVALLAAGFLLVTGGSDEPSEAEDLDLGQTAGTTCVPSAERPRTFGETEIRNVSEERVTLTRAELVKPEGTEVAGVGVLPSAEHTRVVGDGYPPVSQRHKDLWDRSGSELAGRVLRPEELVTLWVGVQAPSGDGTADAVRVFYRTADGDEHYQDTLIKLILAKDCDQARESLE